MQMLTDNPVTTVQDDRFGFKPYAEILAATISETDRLPFSIGIFGEWGSGKSSLMNMIQDLLGNNNNIKTIWFNPWKYDRKEDLWNALIQTILHKIAEDKKSEEVTKTALKLAKSTAWFVLKKSLSALSAGVIEGKDIENIKTAFAEQDKLHYSHINHFEENFEKVIKDYTDGGKLVIFIDDLDRCLPENAITVLESLKLFIGNAKCVFVLGMDQLIIVQGIYLRFGEKIKMSGRDYLNKIIQVPFYLPPVSFGNLKRALNVSKTAQYSESIWKLLEYGFEANPRKTKRFINCFYLLREILRNPDTEYGMTEVGGINQQVDYDNQEFYLAKMLIFQMAHTEFYTNLRLYPEDWQFVEEKLVGQPGNEVEKTLTGNKPLTNFWENESFKSFMNKANHTKNADFPPPPTEEVVRALLKAITLIGTEGSGSEAEMAQKMRNK